MPQNPKATALTLSPEQLEQAIAHGIRRGIGSVLEEGVFAVAAIGILTFGLVLRVLPLIFTPQAATPPSTSAAINSTETLEIGDTVAGFTVTSDFGPRDAPTTNQGQGSSNHQGVDLGTPSGTPLLAWDSATVECKSQPSGAGTYAEVTVPTVASTVFVLMHMSECNAGSYQAGQEFGKTGGAPGEAGAGNSSGAHLHFGQQVDGAYIDPYRIYVEAVLTGKLPATSAGGDVQIVALRKAIFGQESGDPNAENASGSGAIGASQIMPANVASWSKQCLGYEISADELKGNLELQTQITDCKLKEYWDAAITASGGDESVAVRRVAAQWYSGDPDLYQNTSPQSWAGTSYPSIADYTQAVLERYETAKAESGTGTGAATTTTAAQPQIPSGLVVLASLVRSVISKGAAIPISAVNPIASSATPEQATFKMGSATGWKLNSDDLGMTAAHVIAPVPIGAGPSGTATTEDGKSCRYTTIKQDQQLDLALLKLEGDCATMSGLNLTTEIAVGDTMTAVGYPQGGEQKTNTGTIKALDTVSMSGNPDVEVSDQMLIAGMSGGPCSTAKGTFGVVANGENPQGQMRPGERGWCAEIPEGWATESTTSQ